MEFEKVLLITRKRKRELAELDALEKQVRALVKPDEKVLAQIAQRRKSLTLDQVLQDVAVNELGGRKA